jgi:hypothetical protein
MKPTDFYKQVKKCLDDIEVQWVHSIGEADHQLVRLIRDGEIVGILTNDGDFILHGCVVIDSRFGRYYDPLWDWESVIGQKITASTVGDDASPSSQEARMHWWTTMKSASDMIEEETDDGIHRRQTFPSLTN